MHARTHIMIRGICDLGDERAELLDEADPSVCAHRLGCGSPGHHAPRISRILKVAAPIAVQTNPIPIIAAPAVQLGLTAGAAANW